MGMCLRGIGIADPAGIIRFANSICQNIYGLKAEDCLGHHFREFYADRGALNQMLAQARTESWPNIAAARPYR